MEKYLHYTFLQTTAGGAIPVICGKNSGQHGKRNNSIVFCIKSEAYIAPYNFLLVYINMGSGSSDTATLDFSFTGVNSARAWEVKVTQLPCNHPNRY